MNRSTHTAAATDRVCGMTVDPATAVGSSGFSGETIYFCSLSCKTTFDATPEKYATAATPSTCCGGHACQSR
jgi:Cu+-exporting ATPase